MGERFGSFDGIDELGMAAIFLGNYPDDDDDETLEVAEYLLGEERVSTFTPEERDSWSRMPYFRADFEGIGELVFAGIECFWSTDPPVNG